MSADLNYGGLPAVDKSNILPGLLYWVWLLNTFSQFLQTRGNKSLAKHTLDLQQETKSTIIFGLWSIAMDENGLLGIEIAIIKDSLQPT